MGSATPLKRLTLAERILGVALSLLLILAAVAWWRTAPPTLRARKTQVAAITATDLLAQAKADQKDEIQDQLDLAQSQLELDKDELDEAGQNLVDAGGNPRQQIEAMVQEHGAQMKAQALSSRRAALESGLEASKGGIPELAGHATTVKDASAPSQSAQVQRSHEDAAALVGHTKAIAAKLKPCAASHA
jgi:hypothetical protein